MAGLTREQILAAQDLRREEVEVAGWAGKVWLRMLTAAERDAYQLSCRSLNGTGVELENFRARFLVFAICDESGKRIFSDDDADLLGGKSAEAIGALFEAAQRLNEMQPGAVEDAKKNS